MFIRKLAMGDVRVKGKERALEEEYANLAQLVEGSVITIKVMVCRRWDSTNAFGKYLSTDYLLSDAESNVIHCTARSNISHRFITLLEEGSVYSFKNFSLLPNKDKFRIRKDDHHILALEGYTVVNRLTCPTSGFIRFPFEFTELEKIEPNGSTFLIDVIGSIVNMGKIRTTKANSELLDCEVMNERGARMRVTLWSPLCSDIEKRKACSGTDYVAIFPAMNVKEFRGECYLSSTSATTILDAPDIPQIIEFRTLMKSSNLAGRPNEPFPPAFSHASVYQLLHAGREQEKGRRKPATFHCTVQIVGVRTKDTWFYFACGLNGCKKRAERSGSKLVCRTCKTDCEFPRASYRLHMEVADSTGSVVLTLFDNVAVQLIRKKAALILEEIGDSGDENVLPEAMLALTGTRHTFEIRSHTYYDHGPYESFTVSNLIGSTAKDSEPSRPTSPLPSTLPLKRDRTDFSGGNSTLTTDGLEGNKTFGTSDNLKVSDSTA